MFSAVGQSTNAAALKQVDWIKNIDCSNPKEDWAAASVDEAAGLKKMISFDKIDFDGTAKKNELIGDMDVKKDTFSEKQMFVKFTDENVSEKAQSLASLMSECPKGVEMKMSGMTSTQLASLFGGIGKKIDDAFNAGEISDKEYEALCGGLTKYTSYMIDREENKRASWEAMKQISEETWKMAGSGAVPKEMAAYSERVRETWQEIVSQFLEKTAYDRIALDEMTASVRKGQKISFDITA